MTYSVGGLVQAADINGFITDNADTINEIWGTGTDDSGYGQTAVTAGINVGDTINHTPWDTLVTRLASAAAHQGTTATARVAPATGDTVAILAALGADITTVITNRRNAATQGSTTTTTSTTTSTWSNSLTFNISVALGSNNQARYFFNCGGQIGISLSHTGNHSGNGADIDSLIRDICSDLGTIWLSSGTCTLAGTAYTGTTKVGGSNAGGATIGTGTGFYQLSSTAAQIARQTSDTTIMGWQNNANYSAGSFVTITASYNSAGTLTFVVTIDEVPNGAVVQTGTTATLTVRPPETTNLTASWAVGTVSVTNTPA
jgi:hypothetical protein